MPDETGGPTSPPVPPRSVPPESDQPEPDPGEPASSEPAPFASDEHFEVLEHAILGETRHLTRLDVARESGVDVDRLQSLWKALGFTAAESDNDVLFMDADVEALQLLGDLLALGFVDADSESAVARSMGRSFARLAEWEVGEIAQSLVRHDVHLDAAVVEGLVAQLLPVVERLQNYTWRRHLASAAGRLLLVPGAGENGVPMAVGFADIVGFTRSSRQLTGAELGALVETFESTVSSVIAGHGGRVIKTIGDEVLYAADDPVVAARIALDLAEGHEVDDGFPEVRVGVAYGEVLSRMGDVFGEVVNIASRLTSLARPGRVLVNAELGELLHEQHAEEFRVRRARTATVKGYSRLEVWSLKRPRPAPEAPETGRHADRSEREVRRLARREAALEVLQHGADPALEALETIAEKIPRRRRSSDDAPED